ncbi:sugar phosphate nucleotidyltransferase [Fodinibius salsisoli]|uniref:glucose-1-phosphate thymidylyltransferase n=1 Tax=Fodinibius salsisoli TaxID=2820877 RepID=A0ABT3PLH6_9BACT|nr:hypothetical protein [Fodinibius salsisoli]
MNSSKQQIIGVIPAAGNASRLAPIPCSKEIFPVAFANNSNPATIKVAVSYLLESFVEAGADQIYIIMRKGKWDIPQYLGSGNSSEFTLAYIITDPTPGTHYTIDLAYRFAKDKIVLLGFPDILFQPKNAFNVLLDRQEQTGADVVLGLFKTASPQKGDMVDIDDQNQVKQIIIKSANTSLSYAWAIAIWTPHFTQYLHDFVGRRDMSEGSEFKQGEEVFIGNVIQHAIDDGLQVEGVVFEEGKFIDIGTMADLKTVLVTNFTSAVDAENQQ